MQNGVLILAPDIDPHACAVAWALKQQGVATNVTPSLKARPGIHYSFRIDADHHEIHDSTLSGYRISAVWNRRSHDPEPICAEEDKAFASLEWRLFQRYLFSLDRTHGDALWVNRLPEAARAENKLLQLDLCRRLGLAFPETIITTDAQQVDALRRKWGRIIFKSFMIHQWQDRETGKRHSVGVTLLDKHSELPPASIAICPGIYQRFIEKSCDIRVTVMGEHMYALSLSKGASGGFVDWRPHTGDPELVAEAITLPAAVESKLRALMRELGLVFGCIDLAVDHDGNYYFLEINQAGQFLFVEDMLPEYRVLQTMTALLASGNLNVDINTVPAVTLAQFRASSAYKELRERANHVTPDRQLFTLE